MKWVKTSLTDSSKVNDTKKIYCHIEDDVRESLYDECNHWMKGIKKKGTPFMGGDQPNLADLAVFGVLSAIQGCQAFQVYCVVCTQEVLTHFI